MRKPDAATGIDDRPGFWSECCWTVLAGLLTAAIGGLVILLTPAWFIRDDSQMAALPACVECHRALAEGSFPLISLNSWVGGCISGEYAYGVFSVFQLGVASLVLRLGLSLSQAADAIVLIYLAVYGSGAFRVGRSYGLLRSNSLVVAFAAALNGYVLWWASSAWMWHLYSLAWLAWFWWGLRIASRRRYGVWRFVPAGVFLYLLVAGDFPFADAIAAVLTLWFALGEVFPARRLKCARRLAAAGRKALALSVLFEQTMLARLWPLAAAWGLGLALAAPSLLAFYEHYSGGPRPPYPVDDTTRWAVPLGAYPALVLPVTTAQWYTFAKPLDLRESFELYGGFVPVVALLAVLLCRFRKFLRRHGWELSLLLLSAFLCAFGQWGQLRYLFRWLPLLHLVLGLLGAQALQQRQSERTSTLGQPQGALVLSLGCWGGVFVLLAFGLAVLRGLPNLGWIWRCSCLMLLISAAWAGLDWLARKLPAVHGWVAPAIMALAILAPWRFFFSAGGPSARWNFDDRVCGPGVLDKDRLYFEFLTGDDAYRGDPENGVLRRFGNSAMFAGLRFVNGYHVGFAQVTAADLLPMMHSGFMKPDQVEKLVPRETGRDGLLRMLGVDGIVLGKGYAGLTRTLEGQGWKAISTPENLGGVLLHWPGPPQPIVRAMTKVAWIGEEGEMVRRIQQRAAEPCPALAVAADPSRAGTTTVFAPAAVSAIEESRLAVRCRVENPSSETPAAVVYSRAWYPGYRAFLNGQPLDVLALNDLQPAVVLPAGGHGELVLRYAPESVRFGLWIALAGSLLAAVGPLAIRAFARRRRRLPRAHVWFGRLLLASGVLVFPSALLWFESPMRLFEHEFDLFLGVLDNTWLPAQMDVVFWGKWCHALGFSLTGILLIALARNVQRRPDAVSLRAIITFSALMAAIYVAGTPWVSPDVFFYLGTGWLDGHFHLSPYVHTMSEIPGFESGSMFRNVCPGFLYVPSSYGPLFQFIAARLAWLSCGNEKFALALFKCLNLAVHAACSALVYRLSTPRWRKLSLLLYAANPIILFSVLTCVHNDELMVLFMLLGFFALARRRPFAAGAGMGLAAAIKYVPLLFLPFICVNLLLERDGRRAPLHIRFRPLLALLLGFAASCAAAYALYPEALSTFLKISKDNGPGVFRNSIYHVIEFLQKHGLSLTGEPGWWTVRAFLLAYAVLWGVYFVQTLRGRRGDPVAASLFALTLYFVTTMQSIQEWYMVWILALAFILEDRHFRDFGLWLSVAFIPLVIFTTRNEPPVVLRANVANYLIVLLLTLVLWGRAFSRSRQEPPAQGADADWTDGKPLIKMEG